MSHQILLIHGPNLNMLGIREPGIYGQITLQEINNRLQDYAAANDIELHFKQSNHEGAIIDTIHLAREEAGAIVINPGAFTHTSVAILDALNAFEGTVIEVHISNVHKREAFRHRSYVSLRADGVMAGFGVQGYSLAIRRLAKLVGETA